MATSDYEEDTLAGLRWLVDEEDGDIAKMFQSWRDKTRSLGVELDLIAEYRGRGIKSDSEMLDRLIAQAQAQVAASNQLIYGNDDEETDTESELQVTCMRGLTLATLAGARGTTIAELAAGMRPPISREHLSRLASGRTLSYPQAVQLAQMLDVDVSIVAGLGPPGRGRRGTSVGDGSDKARE